MIDKRDISDFARQYPETTDCIDELVEDGFNTLRKLRQEHKEKLATTLIQDDCEAIYNIPNLRILLVDLINTHDKGVDSFINDVVDAQFKNNKEMLEHMFNLMREESKEKYKKAYSKSLVFDLF